MTRAEEDEIIRQAQQILTRRQADSMLFWLDGNVRHYATISNVSSGIEPMHEQPYKRHVIMPNQLKGN